MMTRLFAEEEGQTMVEYALLSALTGLVAIAVLTAFGRKTHDVFVTVTMNLRTAG